MNVSLTKQSTLVLWFLIIATVSQQISAAPVDSLDSIIEPGLGQRAEIGSPSADNILKNIVPSVPTPIYPRDEDEEDSTVAGPGAVGILAGLNGIFANLVSGNLGKLVESTFNFVPPAYQGSVKGVYGSLLGKPPPKATTEASSSGSGSESGSSGVSKTKPAAEEEEVEEEQTTKKESLADDEVISKVVQVPVEVESKV